MAKRKRQWSFSQWARRQQGDRGKAKEKLAKRRREDTGTEKVTAAIIVFALRDQLCEMVKAWREKVDTETKDLVVRDSNIDLLDVITAAPDHQDEVAELISNTPSLMLFLEFLISQASAAQSVSRSHYFQKTVEEVCILVEGYQVGLRKGLDVGQHIMGIPLDEVDAMDLWKRLGNEDDDDLEETG